MTDGKLTVKKLKGTLKQYEESVNLAEKILSMTPDQLLDRILVCKRNGMTNEAINVLVNGYWAVCHFRLDEIIEPVKD